MTHTTSQEHFKERAKSKEPTDDQLLHSIAKSIRNDIAKVEFSTEHDPTPADASLSHSFHSMPITLIRYLIGIQMTRLSMLVTIQTGGLRTCYEQIECIVVISRNMFRLFFLASP